jgi:hypothetical protein
MVSWGSEQEHEQLPPHPGYTELLLPCPVTLDQLILSLQSTTTANHRTTAERTAMARPVHLSAVMPLSCCTSPLAHFPLFPSSRLAVLFTGMLEVVTFLCIKHYGPVDMGEGWLEGNRIEW